MPEYKITINEHGLFIRDEDDNPVSYEVGAQIAQRIGRTYQRSPYIYLLYDVDSDIYKIGFTTQSIEKRIAQIASKDGMKPKLVHQFPCESLYEARQVEEILHIRYSNFRAWGEWFHLPEEIAQILKGFTFASDFWKTVRPSFLSNQNQ